MKRPFLLASIAILLGIQAGCRSKPNPQVKNQTENESDLSLQGIETSVQLNKKAESPTAFNFTPPSMEELESLTPGPLRLSLVPGAIEGRFYPTLIWNQPFEVGAYSELRVCYKNDCQTINTLSKMMSLPGKKSAWKKGEIQASLRWCSSTIEGRCSKATTQRFPLDERWVGNDAGWKILKVDQNRIIYNLKVFDILKTYLSLAENEDDGDLYISKQATQNMLNLGAMPLAIGFNQYPSLETSHMGSLFKDLESKQLKLTNSTYTQDQTLRPAQSQYQNPKWFYRNDYYQLSEVQQEKFSHAQANPDLCGHLIFLSSSGPLVDQYHEEHNKLKVIECIDNIPIKEERDRFAAEKRREHEVKNSAAYITGHILLIGGAVGGFITLMLRFPTFRKVVFFWSAINDAARGDVLGAAVHGTLGATDSGARYITSPRTFGIAIGVSIAAVAVGIGLIVHANQSAQAVYLAQKVKNLKNKANDYLVEQFTAFFKEMPAYP